MIRRDLTNPTASDRVRTVRSLVRGGDRLVPSVSAPVPVQCLRRVMGNGSLAAFTEATTAGSADLMYPTTAARQVGGLGVQRAVSNGWIAGVVEQDWSSVLDVADSGGVPLDANTRADMESRLGHDFGDVRVHTDSWADDSAWALNAQAYTVGSNIVFQRDKYDPSSTEGRTRLAHELTHVVQQRSGPVDGTPIGDGIQLSDPSDRFILAHELNHVIQQQQGPVDGDPVSGLRVSNPSDRFEQEADCAARRVVSASSIPPEPRPVNNAPFTEYNPKGSAIAHPRIDGSDHLHALQRAAGDGVDTLARQPATADPAVIDPAAADAEATESEAMAWPTTLPVAARGVDEALTVTLHEVEKGKPLTAPTLSNENVGGPLSGTTLTSEQVRVKRIVNFIKHRRENLDTSFLKLIPYKQARASKQTAGYEWSGSSDAGMSPSSLQGAPTASGDPLEAKRQEAEKWVWEEFAHEGSSVSINAYDEARMTWGRGMAASGGHLQKFMGSLPQTVKDEFLKYGIQVVGTSFHVVNTATGAIETDASALQLMQAHPDILAAFKVIGEAHRQEVIDAQWKEMKTASASVAKKALENNWGKEAVQLVAHFHHAGDAYGWRQVSYYEAEAGNPPQPAKLWVAWMKLLAGKPETNGLRMVSSQTHHAVEMRTWGGGAGLKSLGDASGPLHATKAELQGAAFLADHTAMILPDGASWYVWPRLTPEQEKTLKGREDREFFKNINGIGMTPMLDALSARAADVKRWLSVPDYKALVGPETNEQRIFWAMQVVQSGKTPKRPEGSDAEGKPLVPEVQVTEAQEWLASHKPPKKR
jgi:uncharacterized protein DUF4157